ncbi:hypothetical protein ACMD2_26413 [Ananas comosus]|uniref:Uncharacterized protein n=1 Tax=Ananas comosus TaxID=4615 RepID=A0A199UQL1_ANACO|nr:hypothetical protein ACMD2_26413 [Ananas comosus]
MDHNNATERGQRDRDVERREDMEVVETKQQPDPAERAIGITGFMNRWDAVKAWAKLASMNFRPPESW